MHRVDSAGTGFLYGETAGWHMHVGSLMILDPTDAPDFGFETVQQIYSRRLAAVPELRARLTQVPFGLDRPWLADDPGFDVDAHSHRVTLPPPGSRAQLMEIVESLIAQKLDRRRPLWESWMIDGLHDGRVALFVKMHHALVDGVSGMHLAGIVMDLEPVPGPDPDPVPPAEPGPSLVRLGAGAVRTLTALPWRVLRFANQLGRQTVTLGQAVLSPDTPPLAFSAPRTAFNGPIPAERRITVFSLPLSDIRLVKSAFGTSINDVVLALVGGALREFLADHDALPPSPLVAQVPVSVHTDSDLENLGTQVVNMFTTLATDTVGSVDRLLTISEVTERAKRHQRAIFADRALALPDLVPGFVISVVARAFTGFGFERRLPPLYNAIVSDVRGSPVDLYVAGARVDAIYPFGPLLLGSGLNVTALSHCDSMNFGIVSTPEAIPDPSQLAALVEAELALLVDAARAAP